MIRKQLMENMEIYTSDSSDSDSREQKTLRYGRLNLTSDIIEDSLLLTCKIDRNSIDIETIFLNHNLLATLPSSLLKFNNLKVLDVSSNRLSELPDALFQLPLVTLVAKNNFLTNKSLPKSFLQLVMPLTTPPFHQATGNQTLLPTLPSSPPLMTTTLKELNLSGNLLEHFPEQALELKTLKYFYLGGNKITSIPKEIWKMSGLQLLSMGGNLLTEVPETVGNLQNLQGLILCDNKIENLPPSIARLKNLKSLLIHKNLLRHLPRDIITLKNLNELSLRDNPLVVRFVQDMALNPPTLMELAARVVKSTRIEYSPEDLPTSIREYLDSANCCVNPKCRGVFFDNRVEHIKFVDFCGKYRVPLLEYLCSSKCIVPSSKRFNNMQEEAGASGYMMRKVLLG